jgi:hypothetical protein
MFSTVTGCENSLKAAAAKAPPARLCGITFTSLKEYLS